VRNTARVQQALEREYPIGLREIGFGGRILMSFRIDEEGVVQSFETKEGSGNLALDQAALRVAPVFEFTPAKRGDTAVPMEFSLYITFGNGGRAATTPATSRSSRAAAADDADQPVPGIFDVAPQVRNAARVQQALEREYPIGLRAAGRGGRVEIWFYVNERGAVEEFKLKTSSGNADLDQAALRVAQAFEFTPPRRGNVPVAGWTSLGITFDARDKSIR
jgi:TonB family protein